MDFSQHYFGANQPYQFTIGIPPLTPSHSNSAGSEDFNTTSPPEVFDGFASDQFPQFDGFNHFNAPAAPHAFPGPPTPPNPTGSHGGQQQPAGGAVAAAAANIQPHPDLVAATNGGGQMGSSSADEQQRRGGSNSDEDELTPAQSRRKAQNRAAQRAFRERKERHVKDLEAKLATLEAAQQQTATENERLKKEMQKISTENEILRATSGGPGGNGSSNGSHPNGAGRHSLSPVHSAPTTTGPLQYNPTDFYSNVLSGHANKTLSHRIVTSEDGERLYAAGATWDFIIGHELFRKGRVDVGDVSERLKTKAKCDGQGPVFEERAIVEAIEQSVASGSDELL